MTADSGRREGLTARTRSDSLSSTSPTDGAVDGQGSIRIASWLFLVNGLAWGLAFFPFDLYLRSLGRLPVLPVIGTGMGGPISNQFGWRGVVWLLIPMGLLAWVEVLAGWWLRHRRKEGGWLAIVLLPVSMFFWYGFLLPIWMLLGPARVALVLYGWKALR